MVVESEGVLATKNATGVAQQASGEGAGDTRRIGARDVEGAQGGVGGRCRDGAEEAFDSTGEAEDGAKNGVTGTLLGAGIHRFAVFLVLEGHCDKVG